MVRRSASAVRNGEMAKRALVFSSKRRALEWRPEMTKLNPTSMTPMPPAKIRAPCGPRAGTLRAYLYFGKPPGRGRSCSVGPLPRLVDPMPSCMGPAGGRAIAMIGDYARADFKSKEKIVNL